MVTNEAIVFVCMNCNQSYLDVLEMDIEIFELFLDKGIKQVEAINGGS